MSRGAGPGLKSSKNLKTVTQRSKEVYRGGRRQKGKSKRHKVGPVRVLAYQKVSHGTQNLRQSRSVSVKMGTWVEKVISIKWDDRKKKKDLLPALEEAQGGGL